MEARQAAQAVRLVQTKANMIRAQTNYALLFTRTKAAFQTTNERDVRQEMELNNTPKLPVAEEAIKRIAALYAVEKEARYKPAEDRVALRRKRRNRS